MKSCIFPRLFGWSLVIALFVLLHVQNGVLLRTVLDSVSGELRDTRTRYLGSRPVKLFRIMMQGSEAVSFLYVTLLISLLNAALCIFYVVDFRIVCYSVFDSKIIKITVILTVRLLFSSCITCPIIWKDNCSYCLYFSLHLIKAQAVTLSVIM